MPAARVHFTDVDLPQLPPDALEEAVELYYPLYELEPLAFVLRGLCDRALERLSGRSLACAGLTLRLTLDPRGLDVREVQRLAGHRDLRTTQRYVDALKRSNRTVSSLLRRVFSEIRDELDNAA